MRVVIALLAALALCGPVFASLDDAPPAKVLVTGFLPFLSYPVNPSGDVARNVSGTCDTLTVAAANGDAAQIRVCFEGWVLPVNRTGSSRVAGALRAESDKTGDFPFDAVLHLGLEDSARGLKVETMGVNQIVPESYRLGAPRVAAGCLNNGGGSDPSGDPAVPGAACLLPVTVDLGRLELQTALAYALGRRADALGKGFDAMVLEAWSRDAGTYYCNETLFRTVEAIRSLRRRARSGRLLPAMFVHLPSYDAMDVATMERLVKALAAQIAASSVGL